MEGWKKGNVKMGGMSGWVGCFRRIKMVWYQFYMVVADRYLCTID